VAGVAGFIDVSSADYRVSLQGGLLFVNKKKRKNFMMALRGKNFVAARGAVGGGGSALAARLALQGG
jgi:hypothetical protein